ncbi:Lycopene cyclase protein [Gracilaria domingensis]|nr:Lycopene cyclase protein [Gracilaria domingensis]
MHGHAQRSVWIPLAEGRRVAKKIDMRKGLRELVQLKANATSSRFVAVAVGVGRQKNWTERRRRTRAREGQTSGCTVRRAQASVHFGLRFEFNVVANVTPKPGRTKESPRAMQREVSDKDAVRLPGGGGLLVRVMADGNLGEIADKGVLERKAADGTGGEGVGLGLVGRGFRPKQYVVGLREVAKELHVHMAVGAGEFGRGGGDDDAVGDARQVRGRGEGGAQGSQRIFHGEGGVAQLDGREERGGATQTSGDGVAVRVGRAGIGGSVHWGGGGGGRREDGWDGGAADGGGPRGAARLGDRCGGGGRVAEADARNGFRFESAGRRARLRGTRHTSPTRRNGRGTRLRSSAAARWRARSAPDLGAPATRVRAANTARALPNWGRPTRHPRRAPDSAAAARSHPPPPPPPSPSHTPASMAPPSPPPSPAFLTAVALPRARGALRRRADAPRARPLLTAPPRRRVRGPLLTASSQSAPVSAPSASPAPPSTPLYDVVVIGAGPAGLSLAAALGERALRVFCADANLHTPWPNNYGTWLDDLEPLGLQDCVSHVWPRTSVHVRRDGQKRVLPREYSRVDRKKLKARLLERCAKSSSVTLAADAVSSVRHEKQGLSYVQLSNDPQQPVHQVSARLVIDATGHALKFVNVKPGKVPGVQAAYGIECIVSEKGYPYDSDEMLLMDYRDDHMLTPEDKRISLEQPTFLYVMPLDSGKGRHVFFEETSLVASPPLPFELLKERLYKRLNYYGVQVEQVLDEEFCLIPMGGEKPDLDQRVIAFGGAAAFVHPATGYMIARALKLANQTAQIIVDELERGGDPDDVSSRIWNSIWNEGRNRQRDFFNFGGEYLQHIDLHETRDFFTAFFDLPTQQWADFLSFRLMKPLERLIFGLGVFVRTSNRVRLSLMMDSMTKGRMTLLTSVLPLYKVDADD